MNTKVETSYHHFSARLRRIDKVVGSLVLAICALFLIDPGQGANSLLTMSLNRVWCKNT